MATEEEEEKARKKWNRKYRRERKSRKEKVFDTVPLRGVLNLWPSKFQ